MESGLDAALALRALQIQLDEGVDEWILPAAQSRFDEAKQAKAKALDKAGIANNVVPKGDEGERTAAGGAGAQGLEAKRSDQVESVALDFLNLGNEAEILKALQEALPRALRISGNDAVEALGAQDAPIWVICDPPHREAQNALDLEADPSIRLLRKSLQAIGLDLDASLGKEPEAFMRIVPISSWRMPQDRKFVEAEAMIFAQALEARVKLAAPKAILLAGSNLGMLEAKIEEGQVFDVPAFVLISPNLMLREPLLKRKHWERLLAFRPKMAEFLAL